MSNRDNKKPTYSIGAVAKRLEVSVETIRLYERKGLILAAKSQGNQRLFSDSDIERIQCIRTAINEHKISIEGIRRIQSLVPCWEHTRCSLVQREQCPAYRRPDAGCWTYQHKHNECADRDCMSCKVYLLSGDCEKIKSLIYHEP
jgi:MerR family transcriptional regulator, heat shock protein HspR